MRRHLPATDKRRLTRPCTHRYSGVRRALPVGCTSPAQHAMMKNWLEFVFLPARLERVRRGKPWQRIGLRCNALCSCCNVLQCAVLVL
jgi:hypothetical protein